MLRFLLILLAFLGCATAAEDSPMLALEVGMHTSYITDAAVDRDGRWLVTASEDRTVRIWDATTLTQQAVWRVRAEGNDEGRLQALAISPDAEVVAAAGFTSWEGRFLVYLFARDSGRLLASETGLPRPIKSLAFSPDGKWLVAGLTDKGGIWVLDRATHRWRASDTDFNNDVTALAFHPDGRSFVSSSRDGFLRRFVLRDGMAVRVAERKLEERGNVPWHIAFSPDGSVLALGYVDAPQVSVHRADDLAPAWLPNTRGAERTGSRDQWNLGNVAWSANGERLFAAGRWARNGKAMLRMWSEAGRGGYSDIEVADNTISQLLSLPDGRLVAFSSEPTIRVLSADGNATELIREAAQSDLRNTGLQLSADASVLNFRVRRGKLPLSIDLRALTLSDASPDLPPSLTEAPGAALRNWRNDEQPLLNGRVLPLLGRDESRVAAVSVDGQRVAVGGNNYAYLFDQKGRRLWATRAGGNVWGVAISGDGRWVVTASADGCLRWLDARNGVERLRLFVHADEKRWVLWTPAGEYFASPGAEDLIGWQLNRGNQLPDFFPASRFRQVLLTPRLGERVLAGNSGAQPTRLEVLTPPVLEALTGSRVETSQTSVRLRVKSRVRADAPVLKLTVRVDGEQVLIQDVATPTGVTEQEHELLIPVPKHDSDISVFALNRFGASLPASTHVAWRDPVDAVSEFSVKPKMYVLAVGVSNYRKTDLRLSFPAKDAGDFVTALKRRSQSLYRDIQVKVLSNEKATRDAVLDGLDWLRHQMTQRDVAVLFLAGHGVTDADGTYYYLPWDGDTERLKRSGVIYHELRNTLTALPGKVMLFIDTCYAGSVLGDTRRTTGGELASMINELSSAENGVIVFSASTGRQYSLENPAWGNGAFTKAIVEGLNGAADFSKTGRITHKMLDFYISERVKALTGGQQTPVTIIPRGVPDFPIAILDEPGRQARP